MYAVHLGPQDHAIANPLNRNPAKFATTSNVTPTMTKLKAKALGERWKKLSHNTAQKPDAAAASADEGRGTVGEQTAVLAEADAIVA